MIPLLWAAVLLLVAIRVALFYKPQPPEHRPDAAGCLTIGSREVQEDCYRIQETAAGLLLVLADGMGKAYGGRLAARAAAETFQNLFLDYNAFDNPPYFFRKAFQSANREILKLLDNGQTGAASVGACVIIEQKLYYAVAGNVKVCVYRDGELVPMSVGHTLDQLAEQGFRQGRISREEAISLLADRRLYNFVGQDEFRDIELYDTPITLQTGDVVVLMSDGVFDALPWKAIEDVLAAETSSETASYRIIELVNRLAKEDKDNASLVLCRV